jgi:hypothetical protein
LRVASIVYWDFLDAHGGHYTATVYIRFHYFFAIHFNSRKTPVFVLHVESHRFLELLLLLLMLLLQEPEGVGVAATRGSLRWYWRALAYYIPANQRSGDL